jgi:hypothetical protein
MKKARPGLAREPFLGTAPVVVLSSRVQRVLEVLEECAYILPGVVGAVVQDAILPRCLWYAKLREV